ncbi:hypothetical protein CSKR_202715 [Clonorchis sinensis]|uniref:Uncharacterized protein n=1 Tax=Clonorchis sinensis TaxID=79923 RepID=A0A8T1M1H9_CLOSI|nr:hypothetical protein CSKR_202715 [Clonorchis sinensis]
MLSTCGSFVGRSAIVKEDSGQLHCLGRQLGMCALSSANLVGSVNAIQLTIDCGCQPVGIQTHASQSTQAYKQPSEDGIENVQQLVCGEWTIGVREEVCCLPNPFGKFQEDT